MATEAMAQPTAWASDMEAGQPRTPAPGIEAGARAGGSRRLGLCSRLLAQLTANGSRREHGAVDVHVIGGGVLPDRLDQLLVDAGHATARGSRPRKRLVHKQGDHHRAGRSWGRNVDVRGGDRPVNVLPVEVAADLMLALIEGDGGEP